MAFKPIKIIASLGRPTFGDGRDVMVLELEDATSGLLIAQIEMSPDQFMDFMSNRSAGKLNAKINLSDNIGKKREHLQVEVYVENSEQLPYAFVSAETSNPGWIASREKFNGYRYNYKTKMYRIDMYRYVEIPNE